MGEYILRFLWASSYKNLDVYIKSARSELPNILIEIVTNGDPLLAKNGKSRLKELYSSRLNNCRVSLYDGPHQIEQFESLKKEQFEWWSIYN